ncbi:MULTISPECIES: AraC family transcriptional regulator [unclassified Alcanivorax]|jgi:AraC-like DNA-binding protein|uniref:AraC family transcriptional regulator n=1 Tax=unclassified Alcanivorax TaxID=2638842 RepID=UPI0007B7A807|nr:MULTISPECIES: AraC family transcriptional regulator [unclassified Alcanivorax]KZX76231.1 AraC family transcriptional regulator [Alcanivorax sp. HI0013]KZX85660.1 AraC family transcriptional regulator [Alcanivorax sp. HI0011]KZY19044.1 AraC family transcriptional regulator [Alcanivorax sp. HI0035]MEE3387231.1 AraC family transcriptional regulator ligand-binding domain-containing protein [Pseudomonadota bacterium]KZX69374.1 AraC family transcriptional regulator [Alcanivorax sp. HI0007]
MTPDLALTYCRMIAQTLGLDDTGLTALVRGTGIDEETLLHSDGFIDWDGTRQLIANAHQLTDQPDIALQSGLRALPAMHGPMGMAAMASPTLRDAMRLFARFNNTRTRIFNTVMEETPERITLRLVFAYPHDSAIRFLTESAMASSYACYVMLRGRPLNDGCVYFNYPAPPWADAYPQVFRGMDIVFDAPDAALSLPASYGDEALHSHDRDLLWVAIRQCEVRQETLRKQGTLSDRVLSLLHQEPGKATLESIADQLHMSPRTLIRKLKQENTRFQQLLDQTLSRRAAQLLSLPHYTVAAVAEDLGYTDVASFRRAFQRWFGTSPSRFRQQ